MTPPLPRIGWVVLTEQPDGTWRVRRDLRRRRRSRHLRARLGGYFWLPCPTCSEPFGGHETGPGSIPSGDTMSQMICPACTAEMGEVARRTICDRQGHDWSRQWHGELRDLGVDDDGHVATLELDLAGPPTAVICATCWLDSRSDEA